MTRSSDAYAQVQRAVEQLSTPCPGPPLDTLPILLIPIARRDAHRQTLQNARLVVDQECAALDKLMETLHTIKQQALMRRATVMHALNPVSALSPELLSTIFLYAVTDAIPAGLSLTCAKSISHVCGCWRDVAIKTSALWTNIQPGNSLNVLPASMALVEACITRSARRPLSALVHANTPSSDRLCLDVDVRSRLQDLYVSIHPAESANDGMVGITGPLGTRCYPVLHGLTVQSHNEEDEEALDIFWFPDVFPSLSLLRLDSALLPDLAQLGPTLSSLIVSYPPGMSLATDTVAEVLKCLNLSFLQVSGDKKTLNRDDHSGAPISLVQLRHMNILDCGRHMTIGIMDAMRAPALLHLDLHLWACHFNHAASRKIVAFVSPNYSTYERYPLSHSYSATSIPFPSIYSCRHQ